MRNQMLMALAIASLGLVAVAPSLQADEAAKPESVTGVLVDQKCGANMMKKADPQKAASKHEKSCAVTCAKSGYAVIVGKKEWKFDDKGNKLAKEYLARDGTGTQVIVTGTEEGDVIHVTSIDQAGDADK